MKFNRGDLVRPINTHDKDPRLWWLNDSLIGEVLCIAEFGIGFRYFRVRFGEWECSCAENSLIRVPSDREGRMVVRWDWRQLIEKINARQ